MNEDWNYKLTPSSDYPVLFNYIHHTFSKLEGEGKIEVENDYSIFNTGLVTENQEEVYAYFQSNKNPRTQIKWFFIGWRKASDRDLMKFSKLPGSAHYFQNPAELIYDTRLDLRINVDHIITDNKSRFPATLSAMDNYQLGILLQGTIDDAKRRIKRNYKTAIPQFYKGKLQLLLPLCLMTKAKADLALVVEKENDIYRASTCLTLDMAINNARLIAKPDDEWLRP
ncbi:hypothetical protein GCM10022209_41210 [Chitinophaga oryziterrae]